MAELDKILKARTSIVLSNPFFASILLKRDIIEDNSQPTAYTDGKTIGYNRKFMEALTPEEIKGVFIHEVKHIILLHMLRKGNRNHMKANIACLPPGEVILGKKNKKIEEIVIGDEVFGLNGESNKVVQTYKNSFEGDLIKVKAKFLFDEIKVTPEHPLLVAKYKIVHDSRGKTVKVFSNPEFIEAKNIPKNGKKYGYCLVIPKIKESMCPIEEIDLVKTSKKITSKKGKVYTPSHIKVKTFPITEESAWVMGAYVADGSSSGNGINFSFSKNEIEYATRTENFFKNTFNVYTSIIEIKNVLKVYVSSTILERVFKEWFGRGAKNKKIPYWIMNNKEDIVKSFINGCFCGDGCFSTRNNINYSTSSSLLAKQMQLLLARFDGVIGIGKMRQKEGRIIGERSLPKGELYSLTSSNEKIRKAVNLEGGASQKYFYDRGEYILIPIKEISKEYYKGYVYNIATEDHTYLVSNAVVHNCDLAINPLILDYGFSLPKACLLEPEFKGMAFEQIYDKLPEPITITMSMSGKGEGDEQSQGIERNGKTFKEFDDVRSPKNADGSELSEGQMKEIEQEIKIDVQQAYQIAKKQGNLPAGMERWIKDFLEPTINWREVLAQFIVQNTRNDYSWNRPNKRYLRQDLYAPSLNKPEIGTVAIGIDTSGSIGQKELDTFASEVKAILGLYCNKVFVIYCDSKVAHVDEFDNPNDIELKPYGGGGTACTPVFSYIQKHEINPVIAIHFTDGYVDDYETKVIKEADYDILWVLSPDSNKHFKPSTGTVVEIK